MVFVVYKSTFYRNDGMGKVQTVTLGTTKVQTVTFTVGVVVRETYDAQDFVYIWYTEHTVFNVHIVFLTPQTKSTEIF